MTSTRFAYALSCVLALAGCDGGDDPVDAGPVTGTDSGPVTGTDSGPTGTDSGPVGTDAGPVETDAGPEPVDAGPAGPIDAGPPPSCDMGRIRIQPTCDEFTACGGDLLGGETTATYCYSDVCIEHDEIINQLIGRAPGACGEAGDDVVIYSGSGMISGEIEFTGTTVRRDVSNTTMGSIYLPPPCKFFSCSATATAVRSASEGAITEITCADAADGMGCDCDLTFISGIDNQTTGYTAVDADTIETTGGDQQFDYCVDSAGNLTFRDVSASPEEPGTQIALPSSST